MLKSHVALGLAVISATTFAFMSGEWYALSRVSPTDRLDVSAFERDSRLSSDLGDWAAAAAQAVSVPARPSDKIPAGLNTVIEQSVAALVMQGRPEQTSPSGWTVPVYIPSGVFCRLSFGAAPPSSAEKFFLNGMECKP